MFSRIKPDNAFVHEPYIYEQDRLMTYVFNPPPYFNEEYVFSLSTYNLVNFTSGDYVYSITKEHYRKMKDA